MVASSLLLGVQRKWLGCVPRSQFDPVRTSQNDRLPKSKWLNGTSCDLMMKLKRIVG
jgi:hypothetical protein